jgi:hypothetical protein
MASPDLTAAEIKTDQTHRYVVEVSLVFGRPSSSRRWSTKGPPIALAPLAMLRVVKMDRSVEECVSCRASGV